MALSTAPEIEAVGDLFEQCADVIRHWRKRAYKNENISIDESREIFQQETLLRQHAEMMFIKASSLYIQEVEEPQSALIATIEEAKEELESITKIRAYIDLVADLVGLAASIYAGKPKPILSGLKEVREDIKALT